MDWVGLEKAAVHEAKPALASLPTSPLPITGADPEGHPTSLSGHRLAAPVQCHRYACQEPVLRATQDVLTMREVDPQGHCPHLPRA